MSALTTAEITAVAGAAADRQADTAPREFLTFRLGAGEYGIDILKVQEIRGYEAVTRIANAPAFIKGVINLRGVIVPIVDLRLKFNLGEAEYNAFRVVIILNIAERVVGAVVDSVNDVLELGRGQIKPAPQCNSMLDADFITGLATVAAGAAAGATERSGQLESGSSATAARDRMLILIDIERLLSGAATVLVDTSAH